MATEHTSRWRKRALRVLKERGVTALGNRARCVGKRSIARVMAMCGLLRADAHDKRTEAK